jgi:hypothetical protein
MDSGSTGNGTTAGTKSGQVPAIVQVGITQTPPGQLYN